MVFDRGSMSINQRTVNDLEICPMDIERLPVNHELGTFGDIVRDLPIDIISGVRRDRLSELGLDDDNAGFSECILVAIQEPSNGGVIRQAAVGAAFDDLFGKVNFGIQAVLHENTGIAAALHLIPINSDSNDAGQIIVGDRISFRVIACRGNLITGNADLVAAGLHGQLAVVIVRVDMIAIADEGTGEVIDGRLEKGASGKTGKQKRPAEDNAYGSQKLFHDGNPHFLLV